MSRNSVSTWVATRLLLAVPVTAAGQGNYGLQNILLGARTDELQ